MSTGFYVFIGYADTSDPLERPSEEVYAKVPRFVYRLAKRLGFRVRRRS